jgi:type 1 glutamine amidotransferase
MTNSRLSTCWLASVVALGVLAVAVTASEVVLAQAAATSDAAAPHVAFVTGDDEYRSEVTMPMIAKILSDEHGMRTSVAYARPKPQTKEHIEGLEALDNADLMVIFTRFRQLPDEELQHILDFTKSGKPMIGLRTTTHAFQYPDGHPRQDLNDGFGRDIFGQKWIVHHGHESTTDVAIHEGGSAHPILRGIEPFHARSWLYHVAPLHGDDNTILLDGTSVNSSRMDRQDEFPLTQPVAWTRTYRGARVFFTTLGHPADFEQESMRRLLINAIYWALGTEVPRGGAKASGRETYTAPEVFDLSKVG